MLKFPWVMRPVLIRLPLSGDLVEAAGQREVLVLVEPQLWRVHYCNVMEGAAIQKAGVIFCTLDHLLFKARPVLHWCCYEWGFALLWLLLHRYDYYCCYCEGGATMWKHPLLLFCMIHLWSAFWSFLRVLIYVDPLMFLSWSTYMIRILVLSKSLAINM